MSSKKIHKINLIIEGNTKNINSSVKTKIKNIIDKVSKDNEILNITEIRKKNLNTSYKVINNIKCFWGNYNLFTLAYNPICTSGSNKNKHVKIRKNQ